VTVERDARIAAEARAAEVEQALAAERDALASAKANVRELHEQLAVERRSRVTAEGVAADLATEPERRTTVEARNAELERKLVQASAAPAEPPVPVDAVPVTEHTIFFRTAAGYRLEQRQGPPPNAGETVAVGELRFEVLRVGPGPAPGTPVCAYLVG
jgi:hypothetical protein